MNCRFKSISIGHFEDIKDYALSHNEDILSSISRTFHLDLKDLGYYTGGEEICKALEELDITLTNSYGIIREEALKRVKSILRVKMTESVNALANMKVPVEEENVLAMMRQLNHAYTVLVDISILIDFNRSILILRVL